MNLLDVPIPALSSDFLSRWMLHTNSCAFHQRLLASHLTDSVRSDITDWGVTLLNWPEQSHLPCTVHPHSGRPWIQGWRSVMRRTKKDAVIS